MLAFVVEEPLLAVEPAAVAAERAVGTHDAVAGYGDAGRIAPRGGADGANRGRPPDRAGDLAVRRGAAGGNLTNRLPDLALERRAREVDFDPVERADVAVEVGAQRVADGAGGDRELRRVVGAAVARRIVSRAQMSTKPASRSAPSATSK